MKMAVDYSSLFNFTLPRSMEKFQAALVGTVKPIRDKTGLDITEKTLQATATNIGVEKSVASLNQVEKRLLRIIALQDQLSQVGAMGDFAKTLNKIFRGIIKKFIIEKLVNAFKSGVKMELYFV